MSYPSPPLLESAPNFRYQSCVMSARKPYRSRSSSKPAGRKNNSQGGYQRHRKPTTNNAISFEALADLRQRWLTANEDTPQPLDRWLKHVHQDKTQTQQQRWLLNSAMIQASRFQQLAQALEDQFFQDEVIDWQQWDNQWSQKKLNAINDESFWYWIGLHCGGQWLKSRHDLSKTNLRDTSYRERLYAALREEALEQPLSPLWLLWHGIRPQWLPLLKQRAQQSGWDDKQLQRFIRKQNDFPPLWLRTAVDADLPALEQSLQQQGIDAQLKHINGDTMLAAYGGKAIQTAEEYQQGQFEIQDLASQQIAAAIAAKPGDKVWDACAGAGGKSLAIASRLAGKGSVTATDLHSFKLDELKRRAKRAQIQNIRSFSWDGSDALRLPAEIKKQQGFDWVLIDAPCTSAGTWRRNPDARWRFNGNDTQRQVELQQQILHHACKAVRPGGQLVYATCSWQLAENEQQVEHFLQQHPEFELLEQCMLGAPDDDADCMFYAKLIRKAH